MGQWLLHQLLLKSPYGRPSQVCAPTHCPGLEGTVRRKAVISTTARRYSVVVLLERGLDSAVRPSTPAPGRPQATGPPLDVGYVPLIRASAHTMIPPGIIYWQRPRGSGLSSCSSGYRCANCQLGRWPKKGTVLALDHGTVPVPVPVPSGWDTRRHRLPVGTVSRCCCRARDLASRRGQQQFSTSRIRPAPSAETRAMQWSRNWGPGRPGLRSPEPIKGCP